MDHQKGRLPNLREFIQVQEKKRKVQNEKFVQSAKDGKITKEIASKALDMLEVDSMGLDMNDRTILLTIIDKFQGGPVGLDTLAAAVGEDSGTIEEIYEPYLVKNGFLFRTPKGRMATDYAYEHFGLDNLK